MDKKYTNDTIFQYYKDLDKNFEWLTQNIEEQKGNKERKRKGRSKSKRKEKANIQNNKNK